MKASHIEGIQLPIDDKEILKIFKYILMENVEC
jgi:hypothetical protein